MSEIISSDGTSESTTDPMRKPKPQPFPQGIPQPRAAGEPPRAAGSIYEESQPVVRSEAAAESNGQPTRPAVTGNAPERQPAENPFPKQAPAAEPSRVQPISDPRTQAAASSTMKAAEQLRAAAGEKARQLRQAAEAKIQAAQANQRAQADATAEAKQAEAQARADAEAQAETEAQAEAVRAQMLADIPVAQPAQTASSPVLAQAAPAQQAAPAPAPAQQAAPAPAPAQQAAPAAAQAAAAATLSPSAEQKIAEWKEIAEATWADASIVLKDIQQESERYIRANPTRAALTALGVGFVLGVFLKR